MWRDEKKNYQHIFYFLFWKPNEKYTWASENFWWLGVFEVDFCLFFSLLSIECCIIDQRRRIYHKTIKRIHANFNLWLIYSTSWLRKKGARESERKSERKEREEDKGEEEVSANYVFWKKEWECDYIYTIIERKRVWETIYIFIYRKKEKSNIFKYIFYPTKTTYILSIFHTYE